MKLKPYLEDRDESENAFALRAKLSQSVVNRVCNGFGCSPENQRRIVHASRKEPATCGGTVTYEDLIPNRAVRRKSA